MTLLDEPHPELAGNKGGPEAHAARFY